MRRHRDIAKPVALPMDSQVRLASGTKQIARLKPGELLKPQAAIGEHTDDHAVAFAARRGLELAELVAAQDVSKRALTAGRSWGLAVTFSPCRAAHVRSRRTGRM